MVVLFSPFYATSVLNQVNLIRRLLEEKGKQVVLKNFIALRDANASSVESILWFKLALPEMLNECTYVYLMCNKPRAIYVTIEGIPILSPHTDANLLKIDVIANSNFTKECLTSVGMRVKDVVHHGVDYELCKKIFTVKDKLKQRMHEKFGNKCIFLVNARLDPRKGFPFLERALREVDNTHHGKFIVLMHVDKMPVEFKSKAYCYHIAKFGSLKYLDVLKLMASVDYLIFPTLCEGFGLPLLEANAVGTPVVHSWFPPLSEFSSKDFNFVFDYMDKQLVKPQAGQYWVFHVYDPEHLADMIKFAIDVYFESREEYQEYCAKAHEHAKNWDYRLVYSRLLAHIGV